MGIPMTEATRRRK